MATAFQFTPNGGPRLNVEDGGGAGLPMLFQHGLCGDARQTAEVFPVNPAFRRITLECRGHGASAPGDMAQFSIAAFAADAAALIDRLDAGPIAVGGISMGAAIALRLAVTRPELVRALVIARPAWSTSPAPVNMAPNAEVGELLARLPSTEARATFEGSATAKRLAIEAPDNLASLMGFFSRQPQAVTSALLCRISADGPGVTESQVKAIAIPALVIGNAMDSVHPMALAEDLAAIIPDATLVRITPKAQDRGRYVSDFQLTLNNFLEGLLQ